MKNLNKVVKILALTLGVMLVVALFLPKTSTLKAKKVSGLDKMTLFSYLSDIKFWESWSPMFRADSAATVTIENDKVLSWSGERIGKGSLSIEKQKQDELLRIKVLFTEPSELENNDLWELQTLNDSTEIYWESTGNLSYPMGRIFGLFIEKYQQEGFEDALNKFVLYTDSLNKLKVNNESAKKDSTPINSFSTTYDIK